MVANIWKKTIDYFVIIMFGITILIIELNSYVIYGESYYLNENLNLLCDRITVDCNTISRVVDESSFSKTENSSGENKGIDYNNPKNIHNAFNNFERNLQNIYLEIQNIHRLLENGHITIANDQLAILNNNLKAFRLEIRSITNVLYEKDTFMKSPYISVVSTLLGVILGSFLTYLTGKRLSSLSHSSNFNAGVIWFELWLRDWMEQLNKIKIRYHQLNLYDDTYSSFDFNDSWETICDRLLKIRTSFLRAKVEGNYGAPFTSEKIDEVVKKIDEIIEKKDFFFNDAIREFEFRVNPNLFALNSKKVNAYYIFINELRRKVFADYKKFNFIDILGNLESLK